jgi:hypothetical protein
LRHLWQSATQHTPITRTLTHRCAAATTAPPPPRRQLTQFASFVKPNVVSVSGQEISADHILIAVGGKPNMPSAIPGIEHCISSDGFFGLKKQPKKVRARSCTTIEVLDSIE